MTGGTPISGNLHIDIQSPKFGAVVTPASGVNMSQPKEFDGNP